MSFLKSKFLFVIIIGLFISSCEDMELCFYEEDFGEIANRDYFNVYSSEDVCFFNESLAHSDSTQSYSVQKCITETKLSDVKTSYENRLDSYFGLISDFGTTVDGGATCSQADPHIANNTLTPIMKDKETEAINARQNIYTSCVEYCVDNCEKSGGVEPKNKWTKANIKGDNNYIGINLTPDSYVYVTASGSIVLSSGSESKTNEYKTIGLNDVNYTSEIPGGDYLNLQIDYNTKSIASSDDGLNNLKARTVIDLRTINSDLKVDNDYKYQQPIYNAFKCSYMENNNNVTRACNFDFGNTITDVNAQNKITNYYSNNYNFSIFDYVYQEYASDITNNITYVNPDSGNVVNNYQSITVWNETYISYKNEQNNYEYTDSYILSKSVGSVSFNVNKPTKLAIRYIGTTKNNINCKFDITDENNYILGNENKVVNESVKYSDISYSAVPLKSTNNTNEWQVLKSSSGNEIIFNQFSTPNKTIESKIDINLNVNSSDKDCSSGFLIKLIPLKDYEVTKTGLLFFDFVGVSAGEVDIKYNIINPNSLYKSGLTNNAYKLKDFYENGDAAYYGGSENRAWKTIKNVNSSNISNIDSNNFTSDLLKSRSIFVRKGQIIRFDYSNWMELDNKEKIGKRYDSLSGGINIDRALSLHAYIKERPAYFCVGNKKEVIDIETECLSVGGQYRSMYVVDSGGTKNIEGKCYVESKDCMVTNELVNKYDNIDGGKDSCEPDSILSFGDEIEYTTNLSDFWNMIYTSYNNATHGECYKGIINDIYALAKKCKNTISSGYDIYKGVLTNGVEDHIKKQETLSDLSDTTDVGMMITNLNNFFGTILTEGKNKNDSTIYTSKSPFYYFISLCTPEGDDGLCYTKEIPMCYDLTNYDGSTVEFINRTLDNNTTNKTTDLENYGTMNNDDVLFGAKRISNFNGSDGLIKNFIKDTAATNLDENYLRLKYKTSIYVNENSALGVYILNTPNNLTSVNFSELYNFFIINVKNSPILKLQSTIKTTYKNGSNLDIIIGENDKNYYSKSNNDNNIYYYKDNIVSGVETKVSESSGGDNNGDNILSIVRGNIGLYEFNEKGELRNKSNKNVGIDFKNFGDGSKYLESNNNSTKNLFFKILDIDDITNNNEGSYKITIKEINETESGIITYFRNFFNNILYFIDGSYINLKKANDNFIACTAETYDDGVCYIYNDKDDVSKNGDVCTKEVEYCYSACDIEGGLLQTCEYVYSGKGFVRTIYETFINDPLYIFMAKMLLILSITWYGFGYFLGMSEFKQSEIIMKIIKMCFIYFLISPNGWSFFNDFVIKFFKDCIDNVLFLIAGSFEVNLDSELSRAIQSGNYTDKTLLFSGCITNLEMIFSDTIFNKMLGLAFSGWVGLIYLYLVFSAVISYIIASFTAMILYVSAQVYMSLVFCFFPLVILFMFFKKTEKTFDNWLGLLIGFAGQQIFLIMTLSFFNLLIYNFIRNTFSYTVCWLPLINMNIGGIPLAAIHFWKIPGTTLSSTGLNTGNEAMPSFYSIITFYMVGVLMGKFISEMVSIGNGIFGGTSINGKMANKITGGLEKTGDFIKKRMKSTGQGFYKGMANRLGGSQLKEFNESQKKHVQERREMRNEHFKDVNEKTKKDMEGYKKSDEFKNDTLKEAKNSEFRRVISKDSENNDNKQKEKNDNVIKDIGDNKSTQLQNAKEFNSLNKEVDVLLQKKEAGTMTKKEEEELEGKQGRLEYLRENKLSDKEYQKYNEAVQSNEAIAQRQSIRDQHGQNLEAIQRGQAVDATEEDKQKAQQAIESEKQLANKNYDMLSDDQKQSAEATGRKTALEKHQQKSTNKYGVDNVMERYGDKITEWAKSRGITEEQWKSMDKDKQRDMARDWGRNHGLIASDKRIGDRINRKNNLDYLD